MAMQREGAAAGGRHVTRGADAHPSPTAGGARETPKAADCPLDDAGERDAQIDLELVRAIRAGQATAWRDLLTRYQDKVFGLCLGKVGSSELAADLTQDVMVKLLRGLSSFDGRARLSTWVYRITLNVCYSKLRSERYRQHASLEGSQSSTGRDVEDNDRRANIAQVREPWTGRGVEGEETRRRLLAALERIDDQHRDILLLRDGRGLEYDEIAAVLEIAVGTVKSRLFRARSALRDALEESRGSGMGPGMGSDSGSGSGSGLGPGLGSS
ncbi:MAG: RNA polymerase sigma factor [Planctomycetota bacterium]|nr:RNA polymerase sigma factor [Planctomycetota bacterium]